MASTEILATVNGEALRLRDLAPVDEKAEDRGQVMSVETYDYLLDRAIQRTLIRQAASARGIQLGPEQLEQLAWLRERREAGSPGQVRVLQRAAGAAAFEVREAEAFLLQAALLSSRGASPHVTAAQVREYYADHAAEFGALPDTGTERAQQWQRIDADIRERLAPVARAQYDATVESYLQALRTAATLEVRPPRSVPATAWADPAGESVPRPAD